MPTTRLITWKTKSGVSKAFQIDYVDRNGDRHKESFSYKDHGGRDGAQAAATKALAKAIERKNEKEPEESEFSDKTINDACDHWLDICKRVGRKDRPPVEEHTYREYEYHANNYIEPIFKEIFGGEKLISDIKQTNIEAFRIKLLERTTRKNAQKIFTSMKSVFIQARMSGWIAASPADDMLIRIQNRDKTKVESPEWDEVVSLISAADRLSEHRDGRTRIAWKRYRPLVYTLIESGCRMSEIRGLPWVNVDTKAGVIRVTQKADENCKIGKTKTDLSERDITISRKLCEMLDEWRADKKSRKTFVFGTGADVPERLSNISRRCWDVLLKEAGIEKRTRHQLRHFKATSMIEDGASVPEVQQELGHANPMITLGIYTHQFKKREGKRRERLDALRSKLYDDVQKWSKESAT